MRDKQTVKLKLYPGKPLTIYPSYQSFYWPRKTLANMSTGLFIYVQVKITTLSVIVESNIQTNKHQYTYRIHGTYFVTRAEVRRQH